MAEQSTRPVLPGEDIKSVSLREFEQRISELRDQFQTLVGHERELRHTITDKQEEARKLNATEMFRRLDELNHAHSTAMENWARSLPRELFDQWQKDYEKWRLDVGTQLTTIAPHASQIDTAMSKIRALESAVSTLQTVGSPHVQQVDVRVDALEKLVSRATGAAIILGFMSLSGVVALFLGLLRLAGVVQ